LRHAGHEKQRRLRITRELPLRPRNLTRYEIDHERYGKRRRVAEREPPAWDGTVASSVFPAVGSRLNAYC
jgi:hypothetical protein